MHFITGGAYNGKRKWVKEQYHLLRFETLWLSAYQNDSLAVPFKEKTVIEGMERYIKKKADEDKEKALAYFSLLLSEWNQWEKEDPKRQLLLIGCDITKGIVPMEQENRAWRDLTGWVYQEIARVSDRVDIIWYGISQTIKGGEGQ
ncbi:bifunctional adenosylcobinamide kinase/adenosylcobinamide-phosphate guanylyltransferase [Metabacillus sp. GX 13764]|uniref:bifunctional adenosylcobinamide kinase/adenosylcobinamide-phosphate guanylyltransferase n=1 Tax=Metabacillus kandeliae TaxID=2900151 RepID=UPI001E5B5BC8|nr:bifunctional adenosylcobinamide kinase/adenosylcobinamide-phosphate guanylyltransferase [Metabacillus kandeliae]MCD7035512.1 bifunctional adenosylcobinamide kinase/adenosylcobinamide-phosphate guanylyltransferase [Metabacillus kandeliae]